MDDWDAQKMLDKYIHDYMIRNNLHTAAETFAKEADISPEPAAVNPPEGFLTEWWSLFWDVYSAKLPKHPEAMKDSLDKNVSSVLQRPDMNCMPPSVCPSLSTPRLHDFLQNVYSTIIPRSDMGSTLQSALPTMISTSELNSNGLGAPPMLDTAIGQGQPVTNWISENMSEQERLMLSARDLNFNARLLDVDQLASLPPYSINSLPDRSYLQKRVLQKPQLPVFTNGRSCTYLGSSSAIKAVPHEALKQKQPKSEPDDAAQRTHSIESGASRELECFNAISPVNGKAFVLGGNSCPQQANEVYRSLITNKIGRDKQNELVSSGGWPSGQDSISYSVEQSVGKQMLTNLGSGALVDDGLSGKDLQSGIIATSVDPFDGYIKSFFSNEDDPSDMSSSFCTSPGSSLSRGEFQPKRK